MPPSRYETYRYPVTQRQWLTQRRVLFQELGDHNYVVPVGGNIQEAIDRCQAQGGGIVRLQDGTHTVASDLTIPVNTPIQILGINMTTTVIDFNSTSYRIILAGSGIYTTGTVTISSGVTVTGSSTAWLSSGLVAGDEMFLGNRWYKIATIAGDTTIILAEGYGGSPLSGASYRAGKIVKDVAFNELTIQGSTSASGAIDVDDARNILLGSVTFALNQVNGIFTNFSEFYAETMVSASATGNGFEFHTGSLGFCTSFANVSNGGHNFVLDTISQFTFLACVGNAATTDGWNITSCDTIAFFAVQANANGGQGFELVSGNSNITIHNSEASNNTSDGIKLTASSDECRITSCRTKLNGAYGINIAASTCDNNIITDNIILLNTSGQLTDSGTGTIVASNVGV